MLKKQTVWLLTMLSLMIVLSVYYMMSDKGDLAFVDSGKTKDGDQTITTDGADDNDATGVSNIRNVGQDELFTTFRMELQNERSVKESNYQDILKSSSSSIDEKNEALDNIHLITQTKTKENILESSILAITAEYEDVLVRAEDDIIHVHVKVDQQLSHTEVVHIMQMVRDEFGDKTVDVNQQPIEG